MGIVKNPQPEPQEEKKSGKKGKKQPPQSAKPQSNAKTLIDSESDEEVRQLKQSNPNYKLSLNDKKAK